MTHATVQRMRGQWRDAETTCRKALEISPKDVSALDMLAGILAELGKVDEAVSTIKSAMELSPGNAALETKYARLVLQKGEQSYMASLAQDMLEHPRKYSAYKRKPSVALLGAILTPGLGQVYNQQFTKAGIIFGTFLMLILSYVIFQPAYPSVSSLADLLRFTHPFVQLMGVICTITYIYGIVDAVVTAGKDSEDPIKKHLMG